jgi:signal transduction histidine kinase
VLLAKTFRSSTFRLALIAIAIFGAVVVTMFGYVYWATADLVRSRPDQAIGAERATLERAYADGGRSALIAAIADRVADSHFESSVYLLADPSSARLAGNLRIWPAMLAGAAGWGNFTAPEWKAGAGRRPLLRASFDTLSDGSRLLVGRDIDDLGGFMQKINTALVFGIALIFVLAGVASVAVTRRTVGRIEAINATSRSIMHSGLGQRIPLHGTRDEWDDLAANLNSMLDRIEALMGEVRQFTDNVAHDLRTPLTRMRGRLEKAYARGRDETGDQSLIGETLADLDAVLRMFTSLTRISQIEASERTAAFGDVDLTELAREVVELFDAAAEEEGGHVETVADRHIHVTGDRDLLFDALANLVDNAFKHGREAGRVRVTVGEDERGAFIAVTDDGPGIPAEERDRVFKRFYRLERSRRTPGNGLGLSLVAAVARLHGAQVELRDKVPGLEARLWFPRITPPAAETAAPGQRPPLNDVRGSARWAAGPGPARDRLAVSGTENSPP